MRAFRVLFPPKDRRDRILSLGLPIIGGMVSQNLLNLVDTGMVSHLGDSALAGVGLGSFANFMSIAFITGLSAGVQAMAARRKGEEKHDETAVPLNGGLLLAAALGLPMAAALIYATPHLFGFLSNDPEVIGIGSAYLQIRLFALPAVGMNFAFRGYWNAVDLSKLYLRTLVVMHVVNAVLDYCLIFGVGLPEMGAPGAALASSIATWVGTAYYFVQASQKARDAGFMRGLPDGVTFRTMMRLALPAGVQQFLFAAGMTAFFRIVGELGTAEVAASNVLINLLLVVMLPGIGFGIASATLVGQALGKGDVELARRWGWDVLRIAVPAISLIALIGLILPDPILGIFLHNPDTLDLARNPLRLLGIALPIDAAGMVLLNAHLGAGDVRKVLVVSTSLQWLFFLPLAYLVGPYFGYGLTAIWGANAVYRLVQSGIFVASWKGDGWAKIKV